MTLVHIEQPELIDVSVGRSAVAVHVASLAARCGLRRRRRAMSPLWFSFLRHQRCERFMKIIVWFEV